MNSAIRNKRTEYLSLLAVISSFAVVYLHANSCFWVFARERRWITANIIESVLYFAVPVFFMISGATLLDFYDRYGIGTYLAKRGKKTLIPYIFWSIAGIFFNLFVTHRISVSDISPRYVIQGLVSGDLVEVYWFFPVLFFVYLSIPVLAAVKNKKQVYSYLFIVCLVINFCIPFVINVFDIPIDFTWRVSVGSGYLLFVVMGYLLHNYEISTALRITIYACSFAGLAMILVGTMVFSFSAGKVDLTFKDYVNVPCIMYSAGIFLGIKDISTRILTKKEDPFIFRAADLIKPYTLSIYLFHWFFLQIAVECLKLNNFSIWYRLLIPIPVIICSIIVSWLLKKIPIVRAIVPG